MDQPIVTPSDLNPESFHIPERNTQYQVRINPDPDNLLFVTATGLKAALGNVRLQNPEYYSLIMNTATTNVRGNGPPIAERNYLYVHNSGSASDTLAVLIMNFTPRSSLRIKLADLPLGAPLPVRQLSMKDPQGGQVWIDPESREVMGSGLAVNQPILVNLAGGFSY